MARVYVITDEEMKSLLQSLELHALREANVATRAKTVDDIHRGFHLVVSRWADHMGFKEYWKRD